MRAAKECVLRDYEKSKGHLDFRKKKPEGKHKSTSRWWHSTIIAVVIVLCYFVGSVFGHESEPHEKEVVVVGGDCTYPPYEFIDANGSPAGFNVELTKAIAKVMEMNVEFYLAPWSEIQAGLRTGQIDAVQRMSYSDERSQVFDFSPTHMTVHQAIFCRKDSPKSRSIEDLEGKELIVRQGDILHDFILENKITDKVFTVESSADAFRLLASGEHDCVLAIKLVGLYWIDKLKLDNIVVGPPIVDHDYCFAVEHGNAELLADFTEGLAIVEHTGEYQEIYDKWLGTIEHHEIPLMEILKYVAIVLTPLLALLVGSAAWSATLKRKVAQRTAELREEIAERKKAEDALAENERLKSAVLNSMAEHVIYQSLDMEILWSNKAAAESVGLSSPEELAGRHCYEIWHNRNEPCQDCPVVKARQTDMPQRAEVTTPDGKVWLIFGSPVRDESGKAVALVEVTLDITERKRAEEEIEKLAKFPSENPDPVLRISKDGVLLYTNTASELLLSECGCKVGEIVCEEWLVTSSEALSSGTAKKAEREVGGRAFSITVAPIVKRGYVNVYGRDITERKRAKESVENLRRQNEMILNSAGEGIFGLDSKGRHTFINPAAASMLGYRIDKLLGQPSHEIWHSCRPDGEIYPEEQCPIYAAYRDGKIHRGEDEVFRRKDGSWFPVEYVSTPIREGGKLVGAVVVFSDITERKRIENELAESEQKYRDLYDYAPVGYHEIDTTGRITRVNQTEARLLGYEVGELIGKSKIDFVVPQQRRAAKSEMMRRLASPWKRNAFDRKFVCKDGRVLDVHIQERPILNEDGKITGIRSTVQDVTERRRTETGLLQMREELESAERFAAAGQIAMQIAHEIGNPIALISSQIQYMIEKGQGRPEDLKAIISHIDSISQLIKRFSELRKERPLRWSEEAIEPIIDSTLSLLAHSRRFAKLTIKKEIGVGLPKIKVDKSRITQILLNLLLNASEACGDRDKITVSAEARGKRDMISSSGKPSYLTICVEDTGRGIKEDNIGRVFEPFYSTKPAGEGTGLGLPVSMGIARQHNGWIDVESSPGKGSKFTLWLPVKSSVSNGPKIRIEAFASESKKAPAKLERRHK